MESECESASAVQDSCAGIGNVRLKGYVGARLDAMIANHVAATDPDYITAPFMEKTETRQWWQTEFWGKWMHAAVPFLVYSGDAALRDKIERGIDRILASQEPCGYIGNYPDELRCGDGWDVWGMKYTMMGLMHYYDWALAQSMQNAECTMHNAEGRMQNEKMPSAERALEAAKRLCDYVIGEIGPNGRRGRELWQTGNWSGYASSSILEPVVWLYKRTGEEKYLDFASFIVKGMSEPESGPRLIDLALKGVSVADRNGYGNKADLDGGYVCKTNRWKAYEMMSCYQGLLDFVEVRRTKYEGRSGETASQEQDDFVKAAVMAAEDIVKEEINLAGGCASSEAWFHGARLQHLPYTRLQETCVTITWMRLCEKLLEVTDDPKWADEIDRTFFNAYLAALKADGSEFAGYTPLTGNRYHGQHHCYMHTDCCTANGPRGFLTFLRALFTANGGTATLNFYTSAIIRATLGDGNVAMFDMYSLYPRGNKARLVSHSVGAFALRLRIPGWCKAATVSVNGEKRDVAASGYFTLRREWALGDIVEIAFEMPVVAHLLEHHAAFTRGPVLLARDSRFNDGDLAEPFRPNSIQDGAVCPTFTPVRAPSDDIWMAFAATLPIGAHHANPEGVLPSSVTFCDYASAGNTWRREDYYRTWIPIEFGPWERAPSAMT